jgi:hypothetical protein
MAQLKDPGLRRFWFPVPGRLGIGVTAESRTDAEALARQAAVQFKLPLPLELSSIVEDVDIRELDQNHVIPNMGPPNFRGVWFPRTNL